MSPLKVFANPHCVAHGWYWALPAAQLAPMQKKELKLFGKTLLLFRTPQGSVHAVQAYCPHMGAHLEAGHVDETGIRCGFHGWKFGIDGRCLQVPCQELETFRVAEKFGMIWIHTDASSNDPLPDFPDLKNNAVSVRIDVVERRACHPTLILGGGVDEEHFLFVHRKTTAASGPLCFEHQRLSPQVIHFKNCARLICGPAVSTSNTTTTDAITTPAHPPQKPTFQQRMQHKIMRALYGNVLRYEVTYWSASTACAQLGPAWFPLYSIFAYRPSAEGGTEGLNIYVTPKHKGLRGFVSVFALAITRLILRGGGKEDAVIQNRIRFAVGPYTLSNPAFSAFVNYVEEQPVLELKQ